MRTYVCMRMRVCTPVYAGICLHASAHVYTHHMPHTSARLHVKPYPRTCGTKGTHIHVCTRRDGHWHGRWIALIHPGIDLRGATAPSGVGWGKSSDQVLARPRGPPNRFVGLRCLPGLSAWPSVWSCSHAYMYVDAYVDGRRSTGIPLGTRRRPVGTFRGEVGVFILPDRLRSPEGP